MPKLVEVLDLTVMFFSQLAILKNHEAADVHVILVKVSRQINDI